MLTWIIKLVLNMGNLLYLYLHASGVFKHFSPLECCTSGSRSFPSLPSLLLLPSTCILIISLFLSHIFMHCDFPLSKQWFIQMIKNTHAAQPKQQSNSTLYLTRSESESELKSWVGCWFSKHAGFSSEKNL